MRPNIATTASLILAAMLAGCGGNSPVATPTAPHTGTMFELPGKKGYFEILTQADGGAAKSSRTTKKSDTTIVVHFYQPDGTTEMSPAPSEVGVKIGTRSDSSLVALKPQSGGGFASDPGVYPSAFRGEVSAKIDGESLQAPFAIR